jgi:hypothetical protein
MEAKRYRRVCRIIDQVSPHGRGKKQQFSDAAIVKVYFWSTHCDRSVSWACDESNWPEQLRDQTVGATLPSQPTMSRRLRTVGVLQLIERVQTRLAEALAQGQEVVKAIDSKPLRIGNYSKDRDAKRGRAAGEMARGYKLHAITSGKAFKFWTLTAMNTHDQIAAAALLPKLTGWGYVSADNGYDANPVYRQARSVNHQLIAPPRKSNAEVRDVRRNSAERIRSLDLFASPMKHCGLDDSFGQSIAGERDQVERNFGNAAMSGLHAPPPWVRTPHRVATWAAAKLIQRMIRQVEIAGLTA